MNAFDIIVYVLSVISKGRQNPRVRISPLLVGFELAKLASEPDIFTLGQMICGIRRYAKNGQWIEIAELALVEVTVRIVAIVPIFPMLFDAVGWACFGLEFQGVADN